MDLFQKKWLVVSFLTPNLYNCMTSSYRFIIYLLPEMLIIICIVTQNPNLQLKTKFFIIFKSCVNSLLNIKIFAVISISKVNGQIILEFTVLYSWNKFFICMQLSDIYL